MKTNKIEKIKAKPWNYTENGKEFCHRGHPSSFFREFKAKKKGTKSQTYCGECKRIRRRFYSYRDKMIECGLENEIGTVDGFFMLEHKIVSRSKFQ